MRISRDIFHGPPALFLQPPMSERIESLFAAVHGSAPGIDGRIFVATTTSAVGPSRRLVRRSDMSGVEVKADSKSMASFGR